MTSRPTEHFHFRPLSDVQIDAYAEQGFLHLDRVLTDAGLEAIRTENMAAWRPEKGSFYPSKTWLQNALLSDIQHRSAVVRPYNALTTLTAMDDTDKQNGCLWLVPASHQCGQIEPGLNLADIRHHAKWSWFMTRPGKGTTRPITASSRMATAITCFT